MNDVLNTQLSYLCIKHGVKVGENKDLTGSELSEYEQLILKKHLLETMYVINKSITKAISMELSREAALKEIQIGLIKFLKFGKWNSLKKEGGWHNIVLTELNYTFRVEIESERVIPGVWSAWSDLKNITFPLKFICETYKNNFFDMNGELTTLQIGDESYEKLAQTTVDDLKLAMKSLGISPKDYEPIIQSKMKEFKNMKLEDMVSSILREFNKNVSQR